MDVVSLSGRSIRRALLGIGLAAGLLIVVASPAAQSGPFGDDILRKLGFSVADVRALHGGAAVVKRLETPVRQELAYVGVVYVDAPIERFVERFRDIEQFASVPGTLQIGRFNTPPRLGDLASLTLPAKDLEALPRCHPGDCEVKLSAAAMTRFKQQVKWSAPTAARQANEVAREMLLELVRGYQVNGTAALGQYNDDDTPLSVAEQFALLTSGGQLPIPVPALMSYLDEYPRGRPPGAEDFFYWAIVDFGLKPTIRVNHVTIYPLAASPSAGAAYAIAIKQLYASHYFHTTLELRFLVPDNRPGRRGFYLVSFTRSRSDGMTGFKCDPSSTGARVMPSVATWSMSSDRSSVPPDGLLKGRVARIGASSFLSQMSSW